MKTGTPMYAPEQDCYVFVTVEVGDSVKIVRWKGRNARSIHKAAKKFYQGATLGFGDCFYVTR